MAEPECEYVDWEDEWEDEDNEKEDFTDEEFEEIYDIDDEQQAPETRNELKKPPPKPPNRTSSITSDTPSELPSTNTGGGFSSELSSFKFKNSVLKQASNQLQIPVPCSASNANPLPVAAKPFLNNATKLSQTGARPPPTAAKPQIGEKSSPSPKPKPPTLPKTHLSAEKFPSATAVQISQTKELSTAEISKPIVDKYVPNIEQNIAEKRSVEQNKSSNSVTSASATLSSRGKRNDQNNFATLPPKRVTDTASEKSKYKDTIVARSKSSVNSTKKKPIIIMTSKISSRKPQQPEDPHSRPPPPLPTAERSLDEGDPTQPPPPQVPDRKVASPESKSKLMIPQYGAVQNPYHNLSQAKKSSCATIGSHTLATRNEVADSNEPPLPPRSNINRHKQQNRENITRAQPAPPYYQNELCAQDIQPPLPPRQNIKKSTQASQPALPPREGPQNKKENKTQSAKNEPPMLLPPRDDQQNFRNQDPKKLDPPRIQEKRPSKELSQPENQKDQKLSNQSAGRNPSQHSVEPQLPPRAGQQNHQAAAAPPAPPRSPKSVARNASQSKDVKQKHILKIPKDNSANKTANTQSTSESSIKTFSNDSHASSCSDSTQSEADPKSAKKSTLGKLAGAINIVSKSKSEKLKQKMPMDTESAEWFTSGTREECIQTLRTMNKIGGFRVRRGQHTKYTLSIFIGGDRNDVQHIKIREKGDRVALGEVKEGEEDFDSIFALIEYHRTTEIRIKNRGNFKLRK